MASGRLSTPQPDPIEMLNEGDRVDLKVTVVNKDDEAISPSEELTISLAPSGSAGEIDYDLATRPLVIATTVMSQTTKLTISDDPDVNNETLTFDGTVAGDPANGPAADPVELLSLEIVDKTKLNIEPQEATDAETAYMTARGVAAGADMLWTAAGDKPDPDATIMLGELFKLPDAMLGLSLSVTADSDNEDVVTADADTRHGDPVAGECRHDHGHGRRDDL